MNIHIESKTERTEPGDDMQL